MIRPFCKERNISGWYSCQSKQTIFSSTEDYKKSYGGNVKKIKIFQDRPGMFIKKDGTIWEKSENSSDRIYFQPKGTAESNSGLYKSKFFSKLELGNCFNFRV